jgi:hypothetical protein
MAQRVLAGNAGVESVRYVLPNKHYIPVDMKYIGVDNTTPYVPFHSNWGIGDSILGILFNCFFRTARLFHLWKTSYASCCGAEANWGATGVGSFLDRCPLTWSSVIADLLRRESQPTNASPFPLFDSDKTQKFSPQWTRQGERLRRLATGPMR